MGRQSRAKRERVAANAFQGSRAAGQGGQVPWLALGAVVVILGLVVAGFIYVRLSSTSGLPNTAGSTETAEVNSILTSGISTTEFDSVGLGDIQTSSVLKVPTDNPAPLTGSDGRPEVLYVGAEFCPYCAAQRWSLAVAMARFGTYSGNLPLIRSSGSDVYPNTPTLTFYRVGYTSSEFDFVTVENADQNRNPLQPLSSDEQKLFSTYGGDGYPFIDFGNRWYSAQMYQPGLLSDFSDWLNLAHALQNPSSPQARSILGAANLTTALVCKLDGNQPQPVCGDSMIGQIESQLPTS